MYSLAIEYNCIIWYNIRYAMFTSVSQIFLGLFQDACKAPSEPSQKPWSKAICILDLLGRN